MNKCIGGFVVCLLGLAACNVEHYDDCDDDIYLGGSSSHPIPGPSSGGRGGDSGSTSTSGGRADAGSTSGGGSPMGSAGSTAGNGGRAGAAAGEGGAGGADTSPSTPTKPCAEERDCDRGDNCNLDTYECEPAAEETCGELTTELACTHRGDCVPIYGGTNCSCGQDCECHGGDPGCVCESFEFFVCRLAE